MSVYYNEIDRYCVAWLRNLMAADLIPKGDIDDRSIEDVSADDVRGYSQCHFFAGLGGWAYAARLAGWPDDRPVWTGSCPCQPYSVAGERRADEDERDLWPVWFPVIEAAAPMVIFGEQVAGAINFGWFDRLRSDLERVAYSVAPPLVIPACAAGAPHKRDRLWFVADANVIGESNRDEQRSGQFSGSGSDQGDRTMVDAENADRRTGRNRLEAITRIRRRGSPDASAVVDSALIGRSEGISEPELRNGRRTAGGASSMGDANEPGLSPSEREAAEGSRRRLEGRTAPQSGIPSGNFWSDAEWIGGRDGKSRPVKSGVRLLAHGIPARIPKLRALGNAIVPQIGAKIMRAYLESEP